MERAYQQEAEERELLEFNVTQHEPFKETFSVELTTATNLMYLMDKVFGSVFNDFHKSQIVPIVNMTSGTGYELNLLFRSKANAVEDVDGEGKVSAFVPRMEAEAPTSRNTMFSTLKKVGTASKTINQFMISQPACELLRTLFMDNWTLRDQKFIADPNAKRYCNLGLIGERTVQENLGYMNNNNVTVIENIVMHIDVNKVLQMIKGDKDENGERLFYQIRPVMDVYANVQNPSGMIPIRSETVIEILRLNGDKFEEVKASVGATQKNEEIVSQIRNLRY
ncbi:MAG: hypothetical protein PHC62_00660 [Candidatus Izemoplasmatales bacterium]|nr:hypothetical protein [Candidatus Izemoplasmatales bacterium]